MRRFAVVAFLPVVAAVLVTGCGSSSGSSGALPTATGAYGEKPTISFPKGDPSATLQEKTLSTGTGPIIAKGDLLVFDYLGQIWDGTVFDNSYDRHEPLVQTIGTGQLIKGWDKSLVGDTVGSRVLLVVPPADGYGEAGQPQAHIGPKDTLVFVIDIVARYPTDAGGDPHAKVVGHPPSGVTVTGALGAEAKLHIARGAAKPTKQRVIVLARGSGPAVTKGQVIVQYEAVDWTNKIVQSTWQAGHPVGVAVQSPGQTSTLDKLVGVRVGSRVLVLIPAAKATQTTAAEPPVAVVLDVIAQAQTAAEAAA